MLQNKRILLGVTGSIAAYKAAHLVRLLIKEGAEVRVIITDMASEFITPLTLATLSNHKVYNQSYDRQSGEWYSHIELGLWADALIIAPATANTLAKLSHGISDHLLINTYQSARCPVFIAPAMDLDMYAHPSTRRNIENLIEYGDFIIDAEEGELASGLSGKGRMAEPENIIGFLENHFKQNLPLRGKKVLINAGPTYEPIDPVRFIGNHSSGRMGYELAAAFLENGAEVTLVSGPSSLTPPRGADVVKVQAAWEMLEACEKHFSSCDIAVFSAAVSDYRPKNAAREKIKKSEEEIGMELVKNPDIAATLGKKKKIGQLLIGFALETENEKENARKKLTEKNLDLIILNSLKDQGAGFSHDTNQVTLISPDNEDRFFSLRSKKELARNIVEEIVHAKFS